MKIVHLYMGKQMLHDGLKDAFVLVIDEVNIIDEREFEYFGESFAINCKLWKNTSPECMSVSKFEHDHQHKINNADLSKIEQCLRTNSRSLFEEHSNLEIISGSANNSKKNGENISFEPSIVLYCSCKGVVPYEEKEFPKEIDGIKTDVREGFFYLFPNDEYFKRASEVLNPLMMGASIGRKDENKMGTLGGFVTSGTGEIGFITCAHVFHDFSTSNLPPIIPFEVVQPSYAYRNTNEVCGEHVKSIFQNYQEVTVDASLVKLKDRVPQRGLFSELTVNDLLETGFRKERTPEYSTGATRDYLKPQSKRTNSCIKIGARSGLTKGTLKLSGMAARCRGVDLHLTNPPTGRPCDYLSQLEIMGTPLQQFAAAGDSGALVFQIDPPNSEEEDDHLYCIGMVVGGTSFHSTVVTPIEPILRLLNVNMKVFHQELMDL
ncbi:uncharacterized protein LOC134243087 [Saccostrea cucullata]|uniref:uncharacterized protein LOC134243087 n=1 Tax=Saccostrea cuccullata TaxID=36930 RepID=UPI002ED4035D